jgi:hypothetical protein
VHGGEKVAILVLFRRRRDFLSVLLTVNIVLLILFPFSFSSFKANATPAIGSTTTTLYSVADTYVNASSPDTNYGTSDSLCVAANSEQDFMYLKFDLTSLPSGANIISARLEIYLSDTTGSFYAIPADTVGAYYCSNNSWSELEITWSNKPVFASEPTGTWSFGMFYQVNSYKTWDVTADVETAFSSGILTEVLKFKSKTGNGYVFFHSREGSSQPRLEVEYSLQPVYIVHLKSAQDPEATNNLGSITFAEDTFSLPTDIDVVTGSYQIAYSGGYMFVRWETEGGVAVSNANSATTTVTVSGTGTLRAIGNVTRFEYAYDHGPAGLELQSAGCIDAVSFTPLIAGQLETARFYMYDLSSYSPNAFKVHVMDENRQDIIDPFTQTPTSTGWFDVDLSSYGISVDTGTDFYIGMEWITDYNPYLGDASSDFDRSWTWNGTIWREAYDAFMIRAVTWTSAPMYYSLTISATAGGSTNPVPGIYLHNAGASVSIQALANADYLFDHWELDGANTGSANPYAITMNADQTLRAIFTPEPTPTPTTEPTTESTTTSTSTLNPVPTATPTPTPTATPSPSPAPSSPISPSPPPSTQGLSLPREAIYAIVGALAVGIIAVAAVAIRKRQKRRAQAIIKETSITCAKCGRQMQRPQSMSFAQPRIIIGSSETPLKCTSCNRFFCYNCAKRVPGRGLSCPYCGWELIDMATGTPVDYHEW